MPGAGFCDQRAHFRKQPKPKTRVSYGLIRPVVKTQRNGLAASKHIHLSAVRRENLQPGVAYFSCAAPLDLLKFDSLLLASGKRTHVGHDYLVGVPIHSDLPT